VSWFLNDLAAKAAEREDAGLTRRLVVRQGARLLDLAGYDYLGLWAFPGLTTSSSRSPCPSPWLRQVTGG